MEHHGEHSGENGTPQRRYQRQDVSLRLKRQDDEGCQERRSRNIWSLPACNNNLFYSSCLVGKPWNPFLTENNNNNNNIQTMFQNDQMRPK